MCLFFYADPYGIFFPFILAAALHELGHLLLCRCTGTVVCSISVTAAGAVIDVRFPSLPAEFFTALAGPLTNLLLAVCFLRHWILFALVNLFLAAYNLLPLPPLDGGRLLYLLLVKLCNECTAEKLSRAVGAVVLALLVSVGVAATCILHYGLGPCLMAATLLLKTGAAGERRGKIPCKTVPNAVQ